MQVASYRSPKTVVKPSGIAGRGLYAAAPLARGEVVGVKGGHLIDRATLERLDEGTRAWYKIDLEPQGWLVRVLSSWMDFGKIHSRSMGKVFDGLERWLKPW